ncbi:hypothetical protein ACFLY5_00735 [Patescibacteria group bacterium]
MKEKTIKKIVNILKIFYLAVAIFAGVTTVLAIFLGHLVPIYYLIIVFGLFWFAVFLGLHKRQQWVVPVVIIFAVISLINATFSFGGRLSTLPMVIARFVGFGFSIFEIWFFTRKEVREYFKVKSKFFF